MMHRSPLAHGRLLAGVMSADQQFLDNTPALFRSARTGVIGWIYRSRRSIGARRWRQSTFFLLFAPHSLRVPSSLSGSWSDQWVRIVETRPCPRWQVCYWVPRFGSLWRGINWCGSEFNGRKSSARVFYLYCLHLSQITGQPSSNSTAEPLLLLVK